jgi:putative SOS response-associated peptidase YedK
LTFAGLWEHWKEKDGLLSFTILTTEASSGTRELHGRMPLVLNAAGINAWFAGGTTTARRKR